VADDVYGGKGHGIPPDEAGEKYCPLNEPSIYPSCFG
jgi:hypothetical protein